MLETFVCCIANVQFHCCPPCFLYAGVTAHVYSSNLAQVTSDTLLPNVPLSHLRAPTHQESACGDSWNKKPSRKKSTGWKPITWEEGEPPADDEAAARCPATLGRLWCEYMQASDIVWETPAATVDAYGALTWQRGAKDYSGEIQRTSDMTQHDLYTVRQRVNLMVLAKRIKEHFWILV